MAAGMILYPVLNAWSQPDRSAFERTPRFTEEGSDGCLQCHSSEQMHVVRDGTHAAVPGCESCHGPGSFHASRAHGGKGFPALVRFGTGREYPNRAQQLQACLACHASPLAGRASINWWGSVHDTGGLNCSSCHTLHANLDAETSARLQRESCSGCHQAQLATHRGGASILAMPCWNCHEVHDTPNKREPDR